MKRIKVNGIEKVAALVIIPRYMNYKEVTSFLEGIGLQAGTREDLHAYHAQHPGELKNRWTAAIGDSEGGKSLAFCALDSDKEGGFVNANTEQWYLMGCSFIGIFSYTRSEDPLDQCQPVIIEKKEFVIGEAAKTALVIPLSRWGSHREITILLAEKGCNLKVGNMEEVKTYFAQHPEDLERKWESRGSEQPHAFRHEEGFDDFFTSESEPDTSGRWCGTLIILPE